MSRLSYQDLRRLKPGQRVRYVAGLNDYFIEATATVVSSGASGATIRLEQIHSKGKEVEYQEGDKVVAGPHELELVEREVNWLRSEWNWTLGDLREREAALAKIQEDLAIAAYHTRDQTVRRRCIRVELVLRAAIMMMRADPGDLHVFHPEKYIASKIRNGIGPYSLDVVERQLQYAGGEE